MSFFLISVKLTYLPNFPKNIDTWWPKTLDYIWQCLRIRNSIKIKLRAVSLITQIKCDSNRELVVGDTGPEKCNIRIEGKSTFFVDDPDRLLVLGSRPIYDTLLFLSNTTNHKWRQNPHDINFCLDPIKMVNRARTLPPPSAIIIPTSSLHSTCGTVRKIPSVLQDNGRTRQPASHQPLQALPFYSSLYFFGPGEHQDYGRARRPAPVLPVIWNRRLKSQHKSKQCLHYLLSSPTALAFSKCRAIQM